MIRVGFLRMIFAGLMCVGLSGCFSSSRSQFDEEKEPHFMLGKSRETAMDFEGAIESFEKAVEVNPRNAAAHFKLGALYERSDTDSAAAIYHFEKFLKLRPESDNAEVIKQHILGCKQVLARAVSLGPISESQQRELGKLADENKTLRDEVQRWRAFYKDRSLAPPTISDFSPASNAVTQTSGGTSSGQATGNGTGRPTSSGNVTTMRTYKVQSGDTMASIARKNGIKLNSLITANPGAEPAKLKIGQTLNLPPS